MDKQILINQLKNDDISTYSVLKNGILGQIALDEEIKVAIIESLIVDSNKLAVELQGILQKRIDKNEIEWFKDVQNLQSVAFNTVFSEIQKRKYMVDSILILQNKINNSLKKQYAKKIEEGYYSCQDSKNLILMQFGNKALLSIPKPSVYQIFKSWNIDTEHKEFNLLLFSLIPEEDIDLYREIFIMDQYFKF